MREISKFVLNVLGALVIGFISTIAMEARAASSPQELFTLGSLAYDARNYAQAVTNFRAAAAVFPSPATLHNLGNAEWQMSNTGPAVLAWERAQWLDPFSAKPRENLRFARKARLLEAPELAWYEICSTWLPASLWPWLASFSFWLSIALVVLPGVFRWPRAGWHQAVAAAGFAIFLLTLPALYGIHARAQIGVILDKNVNLRLTPTTEGQPIAKLAPGETVRLERRRGPYLYVRTPTAGGWIDQTQMSLIARD